MKVSEKLRTEVRDRLVFSAHGGHVLVETSTPGEYTRYGKSGYFKNFICHYITGEGKCTVRDINMAVSTPTEKDLVNFDRLLKALERAEGKVAARGLADAFASEAD